MKVEEPVNTFFVRDGYGGRDRVGLRITGIPPGEPGGIE